jgi:hypothetical protein
MQTINAHFFHMIGRQHAGGIDALKLRIGKLDQMAEDANWAGNPIEADRIQDVIDLLREELAELHGEW